MRKSLLIGCLIIVLATIGYGLMKWLTRPPAFAKVGGTLLVYEIDPDQNHDPAIDAAKITAAVLNRLDPSKTLGVEANLAEPKRVVIRVPRSRGDHAALVDEMKDLLAQAGKLEFRILANERDDKEALEEARTGFEEVAQVPAAAQALEVAAQRGMPPPPPRNRDGNTFSWSTGHADGRATYSWVELDRRERASAQLHNAAEHDLKDNQNWQAAAQARAENRPLVFGPNRLLLYSRPCVDRNLRPQEREDKRFDYFFLVRDHPSGKELTGQDLEQVNEAVDANSQPAVHFTLNSRSADLMHDLTLTNRPSPGPDNTDFRRCLAIVLDGRIMTAPTLNMPLRAEGQISGPNFTASDVRYLVRLLRDGSLPVSLGRFPVQEREMPPGSN